MARGFVRAEHRDVKQRTPLCAPHLCRSASDGATARSARSTSGGARRLMALDRSKKSGVFFST